MVFSTKGYLLSRISNLASSHPCYLDILHRVCMVYLEVFCRITFRNLAFQFTVLILLMGAYYGIGLYIPRALWDLDVGFTRFKGNLGF